MVAFTCHHPANQLTLPNPLDAVYYNRQNETPSTTKQPTREVTSWPKKKFKTTPMKKMKDMWIPVRKTLIVKTKTRIWDAILGSMSLDNRKEGAL
jgi:hypothetical protein